MSNQSNREREIFDTALDLTSPEARACYLLSACGNDSELRRRMESLLRAHHEAGGFLRGSDLKRSPNSTDEEFAMTTCSVPTTEKPGSWIGRYKLCEKIGEGGCGVVYIAEQEAPICRRVALKVIKLGMDTKQVIARFEAERQALAMMDHPNIARVLDAGATETGRPFFVMELVRGIKLTDYCDQNNLPTRERLELFIKICVAVQHAHQKGIIHRDLKPSNILVTFQDVVSVPKIIDFGIAKATDGHLTDLTVLAEPRLLIGTPAYMSPEQAEMAGGDIDTRSDIYSLGVLLYEMLIGEPPFTAKELLQSGLDQMRRTIREREPIRPSMRLNVMPRTALVAVARRHGTEPSKLVNLIRGDLDWIVMKALEKDRARRYETANGLAADIQRHLVHEPVVARPPDNLYRFQKLVRRNKLAFSATGAVAAALIIALAIALVALVRIQRDERQIRQAKDDATEKLRVSYLAEACATRSSGQAGQRFDSLEAVQKAAAIRSDLEARNAAVAALGVSDLRVAKQIVINGHAHNEYASFDLNLERYAFGDTNGNILVRSASNNLVEEVLPASGYRLLTVNHFSPDGKYLDASYQRDREGTSSWVWDVKNQKVIVRSLFQKDDTNAVGFRFAGNFSLDSRFFAGSSWDGAISIFDLALGREFKRLPGTRWFNEIVFNPGDTLLACSSWGVPEAAVNRQVQIRDVASGRTLLTLTCSNAVCAMSWSLDGKRLATACWDFSIYIWDAETGRQLAVCKGDSSTINSLAFSHAGDLLASAGSGGLFRLWNPDTGQQLASYIGSSWRIQFSPDDRYLLGWQDLARYGSLEVAISRERRLLYVPRDGGFCSVPAFSPDGRILLAGTKSEVRFWDVRSGKEIGSFRQPDSDDSVFSPDGRSLITVDRSTGIYQRDFEQAGGGAAVYRLGKPRLIFDASVIQGASLSLDGRHLAVTQLPEGQAFVLDLQNLAAKPVVLRHEKVDRAAISPDGRWAATASFYDSQVKIWDALSGQLVHDLPLPSRAWPIFSPDGHWLATSSSEYQLWEVGSWQPKGPPTSHYEGHSQNFTAFSPDGQMIARTEGHKIRILETLTEKPLAALEAPGAINLERLQFSPDGSHLAVIQEDQQVQLWDLRLIRQELAQMHLDWDLPPYPLVTQGTTAAPVTLEVEPGADSPAPDLAETNSEPHSF